jgi:hypothetical protein
MEPLSILNPTIEDVLNDPRLSSDELLKKIEEQYRIINKQVMEWASKAGDVEPIDAMMFAVMQHHLHVAVLNTKLTTRMADLGYKTTQLSLETGKTNGGSDLVDSDPWCLQHPAGNRGCFEVVGKIANPLCLLESLPLSGSVLMASNTRCPITLTKRHSQKRDDARGHIA